MTNGKRFGRKSIIFRLNAARGTLISRIHVLIMLNLYLLCLICERQPKRSRGRPPKAMPDPIPDRPENIKRALLKTPPKKMMSGTISRSGPNSGLVTWVYNSPIFSPGMSDFPQAGNIRHYRSTTRDGRAARVMFLLHSLSWPNP